MRLSIGLLALMSEMKTLSIVPLNRTNYSTWKLQCRMALVRMALGGLSTVAKLLLMNSTKVQNPRRNS